MDFSTLGSRWIAPTCILLLSACGGGGGGGSSSPPVSGVGFNQAIGFGGAVLAIAATNDGTNDVYYGGAFSTYNDRAANRIVRLDENGESATGFNSGNGFNSAVNTLAMATDGSGDLYAGGSFISYDIVYPPDASPVLIATVHSIPVLT